MTRSDNALTIEIACLLAAGLILLNLFLSRTQMIQYLVRRLNSRFAIRCQLPTIVAIVLIKIPAALATTFILISISSSLPDEWREVIARYATPPGGEVQRESTSDVNGHVPLVTYLCPHDDTALRPQGNIVYVHQGGDIPIFLRILDCQVHEYRAEQPLVVTYTQNPGQPDAKEAIYEDEERLVWDVKERTMVVEPLSEPTRSVVLNVVAGQGTVAYPVAYQLVATSPSQSHTLTGCEISIAATPMNESCASIVESLSGSNRVIRKSGYSKWRGTAILVIDFERRQEVVDQLVPWLLGQGYNVALPMAYLDSELVQIFLPEDKLRQ